MTRSLSVSDTGLRLIKAFEGFRPVDRELVTGARVVGYGHRVYSQTPIRMTEDQAEETLKLDLKAYEELINEEVHAPLTQSQFDALVSLAFNIGPKAMRESDVVRAMNNGRPLDAAAGFDVWRKATIDGKTFVVDALMRRRTAEKSLFLRTEGIVPAPTAMLEPKADYDTGLGPIDDGLPVLTQEDADTAILQAPYDAVGDDEGQVSDVYKSDTEEGADGSQDETILMLSDEIEAEPEDDPFEFIDLATLMAGNAAVSANNEEADAHSAELQDSEPQDSELQDVRLRDTQLQDAELQVGDLGNTGLVERTTDPAEDDTGIDDSDDDDSAGGAGTTSLVEDITDTLVDDELELVARDVDAPETTSPISEAADTLGERLSALLDSDADAPDETVIEMPDSLINAPENTRRSNLVTFPSRQRVDPTPVEVEELETGIEDTVNNPAGSATNPIIIDNLAADDVIRSSHEPKENIYDPDGDPVENATRYLERVSEEQDSHRGGGMWIPLAVGGLLVGISAVLLGRGATSLLDTWGPASVIAAAVTGGLMILFTLYAAARGRFA